MTERCVRACLVSVFFQFHCAKLSKIVARGFGYKVRISKEGGCACFGASICWSENV